jgi:flagellar biosynthesis protein FlhG
VSRPRLGRGIKDLVAFPFAPRSAPSGGSAAAFPGTVPLTAPAGPTPEPTGPTILCVTSGKGGTGKSVLASNLAVLLAATGARVIAVDADLGLANLHLLLGVRPARTIAEVIEGRAGLEEVAEEGPAGVRLAAGASGETGLADLHPYRLRRLVAALGDLGGRADLVLVDTGAGIGRATTSFVYALREIVVVTTPDLTAMADGYAVIKNVARNNPGARLALVVNRAHSAFEGVEVFGRIDRICRRFLGRTLSYLGHVLEDERVPASVAARRPIVLNQPAAPAAACLRGVARALRIETGIGGARGATSAR